MNQLPPKYKSTAVPHATYRHIGRAEDIHFINVVSGVQWRYLPAMLSENQLGRSF